ncbi:MAG: hypothetical protein J7502_09020 [Flavisolibacter sp.]|nr:hypothetical protein [Flavisolibacter sp.]
MRKVRVKDDIGDADKPVPLKMVPDFFVRTQKNESIFSQQLIKIRSGTD